MPSVKFREYDNFDVGVRKLKRACDKAGVFTEARKREYYVPPTEDRKRRKAAARKRTLKRLRSEMPQPARRSMRAISRKREDAVTN